MKYYPSLKHIEKEDICNSKSKYFMYSNKNYIEFKFLQPQVLSGILFNNITSQTNQSASTKLIEICIDNQIISPLDGYFFKKHCFDFEEKYYQKILFPISQNISEIDSKDPTGFNLEFVLLSSYSDQFYIGLNGIQVYDSNGISIFNKKSQ